MQKLQKVTAKCNSNNEYLYFSTKGNFEQFLIKPAMRWPTIITIHRIKINLSEESFIVTIY